MEQVEQEEYRNSRIAKANFGIVILSYLGTCMVYPFLPDFIPIQFNAEWIPVQYTGKWAILLLGLIPAAILFLMRLLPQIFEIKRKRNKRNSLRMQTVIIIFPVAAVWMCVVAAMDATFPLSNIAPVILGLLFIVTGNYLPTTNRNYWIGIRTPWTLLDTKVWRKTNRLGGYLVSLLGLILMISSLLWDSYFIIFFVAIFIIVVILMLYSYQIYRKK